MAAVADLARTLDVEKCIVFDLSGHGLLDLGSYERYLAGDLVDYEYPAEAFDRSLQELPALP